MSVFSISSRVVVAVLSVGLVAACGGRETPVRTIPQAVHPSTSALAQKAGAQGTDTEAVVAQTSDIGYTPTANDGSQPIVD